MSNAGTGHRRQHMELGTVRGTEGGVGDHQRR